MSVVLLILILIISLLLYYFSTRKFNYWKKRKVPYSTPVPLFGNYAEYIQMRKFSAEVLQDLCRKFPKEPYFGTYFGTEPALVIQDPEIIKLIFTKDFYHFNSRELHEYTTKEVITQNLFFNYGDKWKVIRQNMTPLFSSTKLKNMFYLVDKCAHSFEKLLDYEASLSDTLEVKALMIRYTMDCICSCAFGFEANTMERNAEKNPFTIMGSLIFGTSYYRGFKTITRQMWPQLFYGVGLKTFPPTINDFFHKLLVGVFESRNYESTSRHDFVDLILTFYKNHYLEGDKISNVKTGENKKIKLEVNDELLVSQCVVFFAAGFETSATALSLTLYELAKNKEAQARAMEEIDEYLRLNKNKLTFDCQKELPFVDACVTEVLRMYPVLGILTRETMEDYTFPSGLTIEKGVRIHLPTYHLHRDPDNFPDPEEYKPERFLPGAQHPVKPYTFFPFGEGPRTCIGKPL